MKASAASRATMRGMARLHERVLTRNIGPLVASIKAKAFDFQSGLPAYGTEAHKMQLFAMLAVLIEDFWIRFDGAVRLQEGKLLGATQTAGSPYSNLTNLYSEELTR